MTGSLMTALADGRSPRHSFDTPQAARSRAAFDYQHYPLSSVPAPLTSCMRTCAHSTSKLSPDQAQRIDDAGARSWASRMSQPDQRSAAGSWSLLPACRPGRLTSLSHHPTPEDLHAHHPHRWRPMPTRRDRRRPRRPRPYRRPRAFSGSRSRQRSAQPVDAVDFTTRAVQPQLAG
jgi:hypothetical protein